MSYCTECGRKLPENAVFCPNCGHLCSTRSAENEQKGFDKFDDTEREATQQSYEEPAHAEQENMQQHYASSYGLGDDIYKQSPTGSAASGKAAAIVICTVLVLLIIAAAMVFTSITKHSPCLGYWKSTAISYGEQGGWRSGEMYGQPLGGMFELQLDDDNTVYFTSAFTQGVSSGSWKKSGTGVEADFNGDKLMFYYDKTADEIYLAYEQGLYIIFERAEGSLDKDGENEAPPKSANTIAGSGTVGSYYVSVIGAEQFTDVDNEAGLRIYYEFTNNSDIATSADKALSLSAIQDGKRLKETYTWQDTAVSGNNELFVRSGVTIQCCYEVKYKTDRGEVDFTATDSDSGDSVTASYLPESLPGAPLPFEAAAVDDPQWTLALPAESTIDSYKISVKDAQLTSDYYDTPAIRIYFSFTNNSDTEIALNDALYTCAYQDGIELLYTSELVGTTSDESYFATVAPGETVTASCVFILRNETSPVEAEAESYTSNDAVGQTYNIK